MKPLFPLRRVGLAAAAVVTLVGAVRCARPDAHVGTDPTHTIQMQLAGTKGLDSVLARSCGDCHSNSMRSGWFTRVPPFSSVMARGAREGRKAVNFAEWSGYSPEQQRAFLLASCADAKSGRMPMRSYLRFRSDAKLSARDVDTICGASQ